MAHIGIPGVLAIAFLGGLTGTIAPSCNSLRLG